MNILIDADGCPVVDLTLQIAKQFGIPVIILCDTSHQIEREGAQTLVFDKGADSVDFALVNRVKPGDIVVTQDYGLASMCLARFLQKKKSQIRLNLRLLAEMVGILPRAKQQPAGLIACGLRTAVLFSSSPSWPQKRHQPEPVPFVGGDGGIRTHVPD